MAWPHELELGSVAATMVGGGRHDSGRVLPKLGEKRLARELGSEGGVGTTDLGGRGAMRQGTPGRAILRSALFLPGARKKGAAEK